MSFALAQPRQIPESRVRGVALALGWRRLALAVGLGLLFGALNSAPSTAPPILVTTGHALVVTLLAVVAFGLFEQLPRNLPAWLPRWVLQLVGVVVAIPAGVLLAHSISMAVDIHSAHEQPQMTGLIVLLVEGLLLGPWARSD